MTSNTTSTMTGVAPTPRYRPRLMRLPEVCALVGVSRATVYRWAKAGDFPRPMTLSRGVTVFDEGEIDAWMERKRQARDERDDVRG